MNRRGFLGGLLTGGALLVVPAGVRAYSFMPGAAHAALMAVRAELEAQGFPGWFDLTPRPHQRWRLTANADFDGVPHDCTYEVSDHGIWSPAIARKRGPSRFWQAYRLRARSAQNVWTG